MAIKIFHEGPDYVFGQEQDDFRAIAQIALLSTLGPAYATEPLFPFMERAQNAVSMKQYALYWEKVDGEARLTVPVGYVTWGLLSRPAAVIFEKRIRPLYPQELKSGKDLWVIDFCAPIGHTDELLTAFDQQFEKHEDYQATRMKNGKWTRSKFPNRWARSKARST